MNKHDIQKARVENIKKTYPPGTRIELLSMNDAKGLCLSDFFRGQCAGEVLSFTQTSDAALIQRKLFPGNESLFSEGCEHHADNEQYTGFLLR